MKFHWITFRDALRFFLAHFLLACALALFTDADEWALEFAHSSNIAIMKDITSAGIESGFFPLSFLLTLIMIPAFSLYLITHLTLNGWGNFKDFDYYQQNGFIRYFYKAAPGLGFFGMVALVPWIIPQVGKFDAGTASLSNFITFYFFNILPTYFITVLVFIAFG